MQDRIAVAGQHRPDPLDGVVGTADEQRDRPRGDVVRAAADRGVDDVDVPVTRAAIALVRSAGCRWCAGPAAAPGGIAASSAGVETHLLHLLVGEHADDDDVGAVGDVGRPATGCAPSSLIARRFSSVLPSARTSWPASTRRRTMGAPMRPAPTNPTRVMASSSSRKRSSARVIHGLQARVGGVNTAPSGADALAARFAAWRTSFCSRAPAIGASASKVPPKAAMLASALLVADPPLSTSAEPVARNAK